MPHVWVSIGSNIARERHINAALRDLHRIFGALDVSPVYETEAVGFKGDAFLNLVAGFDTRRSPADIHRTLRQIEAQHGRERSGGKFSARTLDLDLLTYGQAVTDEGGKALPRDEILRYAFVLAPLADIAPDEIHPELGVAYRDLWERFENDDQTAFQRLQNPPWLVVPG